MDGLGPRAVDDPALRVGTSGDPLLDEQDAAAVTGRKVHPVPVGRRTAAAPGGRDRRQHLRGYCQVGGRRRAGKRLLCPHLADRRRSRQRLELTPGHVAGRRRRWVGAERRPGAARQPTIGGGRRARSRRRSPSRLCQGHLETRVGRGAPHRRLHLSQRVDRRGLCPGGMHRARHRPVLPDSDIRSRPELSRTVGAGQLGDQGPSLERGCQGTPGGLGGAVGISPHVVTFRGLVPAGRRTSRIGPASWPWSRWSTT